MMWIILIVVVLIVVAAIFYFGDFFNTNTNSNTNTVANTNTETNTNVAVNTNTVTIDTTDWKTYNNSNYQYSVKYPSDWIVKESESANIGPYVYILPPDWGERSTLETGPGIMIRKTENIPSGDLIENTQTVEINGYQSTRQVENGLLASYATYFPYNDEFISVGWDAEFGDQPDYPIYEIILSTFTFTVDVSNWKTYENDIIGLTAKYPEEWEIISNDTRQSVFFSKKTVGGGLDSATIGISITKYNSIDKISDTKTYSSVSQFFSDNSAESKNGTFLGLNSIEGFWPSSIITYRFVLQKNDMYYFIDLNDLNNRGINSTDGRPEFTAEEIKFFEKLIIN